MFFGSIQQELGVYHSKGIKDRASHEIKKGLARGDFDHAAKHVGGIAITPERTGLSRERKLANSFGEIGIVELPVKQMTFRIELCHPAADVASSDTRGLQQQVPDGRWPRGGDKLERRTALCIGFPKRHLGIRKGRNVFR